MSRKARSFSSSLTSRHVVPVHRLRTGSAVSERLARKSTVRTPALPGKVFNSAIKFINPNLDDMTRSARVRVEIDNAGDRELRHKLYADATVALDAPEVVAVPRTAVLWPGRNPRVYVEQEQRALSAATGHSRPRRGRVLGSARRGERRASASSPAGTC